MTTTYTLYIERKYGDSPSSWYPAYSEMEIDEAKDAMETWPEMYGEVSRKIVAEKPSDDCTESFLNAYQNWCNG